MQHTTRNKFLAAVAAGAITCGGAVATAAVSNADSGSPSGAGSGSTSTATTPTSPGGTGTPTGSSTEHPPLPHVTVTPFVTFPGNGQGQVNYRIDGEVLAGPGNVIDYVEADVDVDGKHIPAAHPLPIGPNAPLRPIHVTHRNPFVVDLAPGKHTVTVRLAFYIASGKFTSVTATKTFTVGAGSNPTTSPTTQPSSPGDSVEPPTPSPRTTQLGVTG